MTTPLVRVHQKKTQFFAAISRDDGRTFEEINISAPDEEEARLIAADILAGDSLLTAHGKKAKRKRERREAKIQAAAPTPPETSNDRVRSLAKRGLKKIGGFFVGLLP